MADPKDPNQNKPPAKADGSKQQSSVEKIAGPAKPRESAEPKESAEFKETTESSQPVKSTQSAKADKTNRDSNNEVSSPAELFNAKPMPKLRSQKNTNKWFIPTLISLFLLIAILASSWTLYQQYLFNQNWTELQVKIDSQLNEQTGAINQTKNAAQASVQTIGQTQNQVNQLSIHNRQLGESLLSTQERLKELSGRQKQDWMLAEASYLIKLAQLQLTLQKDKTTAIQLLRTADSRIIEMADDNLLPIRQGIAKDLSDLSLILEPDVIGLSYSIDVIGKQIPNLEIAAFQFDPLEQQHNEPLVEEQQEFDLGKIYDKFLKDFVVIKDHGEPVRPLMTADQRGNLNSNIQLALQQAQIAVAQGNEQLYRLNIENAILWTSEFFKKDESALKIVEQLNQIKSQPIKVNYPNSLNAKNALDQISQLQLYRWLEQSLQKSQIDSTVEQPLNSDLPTDSATSSVEEIQTPDQQIRLPAELPSEEQLAPVLSEQSNELSSEQSNQPAEDDQ
ncbi:MAG: uroporphyrinogen-III C-methyltransferase [Kangiellaceae bacterium]|nr:uroporphyrinogen-III C-methyltransferase [Kangiellaceae bacterium]